MKTNLPKTLSLVIIILKLSANIYAQDVSQLIPKIKDAIITIYAQDDERNVFASGSGFIISSNGIAVTNFHVLQGATYGKIKCTNGEEYAIESIVDYNPKYDLIKFKIHNQTSKVFPFLKLRATLPSQGEMIVSYSNPLGDFENTVSTGVVAAIRDYSNYEKVIQITAPISHGSSGSPVMSVNGDVCGIATFGIEEGQNLNFAVSALLLNKMNRNLLLPIANMVENELETANLKKANVLAAKGSYDASMVLFDQEIANNPSNHLAYFCRGLWGCRYGRYNPALYDMIKACEMDPNNYSYSEKTAEYMKNMVIEGYDNGVPPPLDFCILASDLYEKCTQIDPNRPEAYAGHGYLMLYVGRMNGSNAAFELCKEYLDKAILLDPSSNYFMYRAEFYSQIQSWGKCILDCNQAITINPECYRAYLMRGAIRSTKLRQPNEGILDLTIAVDLARSNEEKSNAYNEMATAYLCKYIYGIDRTPYVLDTALKYARNAYSMHPNDASQSLIREIYKYR